MFDVMTCAVKVSNCVGGLRIRKRKAFHAEAFYMATKEAARFFARWAALSRDTI
jgi:hypothetical protein